MKENVNVKTVCSYYNSATMYGLDSVMKKLVVLSYNIYKHIYVIMIIAFSFAVCNRCLEWLLNNLMTHQNVDLMKELG